MQINITARHLGLTNAITNYVKKKVQKCERYSDNLIWAQVILTVEKYRQVAEILVHAKKVTFRAKEESIDLYAAVDIAIDKIEKQLIKYKEISKLSRKSKNAKTLKIRNRNSGLVYFKNSGENPIVSEIRRFDIKPIPIKEAINEMELLKSKFYMFINTETSQINVIYRRDNGSYGLLEPLL